MLKKISLIILLFNLLNHCEYKPLYSNQNKINHKIIISSFSGDKYINDFIATNLKRTSEESSNKIVNISFNSKYTKNILAKNSAGTITDYQANVVTTVIINKDDNYENFTINEKFNFKKMSDKYEEKNYERNIKKNIANSISKNLILRLAVIK